MFILTDEEDDSIPMRFGSTPPKRLMETRNMAGIVALSYVASNLFLKNHYLSSGLYMVLRKQQLRMIVL